MIEPRLACVKPRIVSPETKESVSLEDEVAILLEAGVKGAVRLVGGTGSGKSTALAHLAAAFGGDDRVYVFDEARMLTILEHAKAAIVVYCTDKSPKGIDQWNLAPWSNDELIEYLLARHPDRCASVMNRLRSAEDSNLLEGNPELWSFVLDAMAADNSLTTVRCTLRQCLDQVFVPPKTRSLARFWSVWKIGNKYRLNWFRRIKDAGAPPAALRLLKHNQVCLLLAAECVCQNVLRSERCWPLRRVLPDDLIDEAARDLQDHDRAAHPIGETGIEVDDGRRAADRLEKLVAGDDSRVHAMAASLLHAIAPQRLQAALTMLSNNVGPPPRLTDACLQGSDWSGLTMTHLSAARAKLDRLAACRANLTSANLTQAQLNDADFEGATLDHLVAPHADLCRVRFHKASLRQVRLDGSDLSQADLSAVEGELLFLRNAVLANANLNGAQLKHARFDGASLEGADISQACLAYASFANAKIAGAHFTGADLTSAALVNLPLHHADFTGACFRSADLRKSDLEGMVLPGANFSQANLTGALLTGSRMPRANFHGAILREAGLADVDWEWADLRKADLTYVSFHMGSSRSGLLFTPIASEGTRTGFYSDDYEDRHYKAPEEIRKANLRGADLRGAKGIEKVDFYLVDLRDALYDSRHEPHLRRCGAILESLTSS